MQQVGMTARTTEHEHSPMERSDRDSTILRLLSLGMTPRAVAERISVRATGRLDPDDIREILHARAHEVRDVRLLPPARDAFLHRALAPPANAAADVGVTVDNLDRVAATAASMLSGEISPDTPVEAADDTTRSVALQYAERVIRQREIHDDFDAAAADETSLHSRIGAVDRQRIYEYAVARNGTRLDTRVDRWRRIAATIADHPESLLPEEYRDILSQRDALDEIRSSLLPASQRLLDQHLADADDAFVAATQPVPARPNGPWTPLGWWHFRAPEGVAEDFWQGS
jgi:hypothetical protein